jgi:hypothetical protein
MFCLVGGKKYFSDWSVNIQPLLLFPGIGLLRKSRFSVTESAFAGIFPARRRKSRKSNDLQLTPPIFRPGARFSATGMPADYLFCRIWRSFADSGAVCLSLSAFAFCEK